MTLPIPSSHMTLSKDIMIKESRDLRLWEGRTCHKNTQTKQQLVTNFVNGSSTVLIKKTQKHSGVNGLMDSAALQICYLSLNQ